MSDKADLLAELVAADATIRQQAKEIERLKSEVIERQETFGPLLTESAEEIERLRKEVAELRKATGWQPIETAPINRPAIFYHPAETGRPSSEWIRVGYFSDTRNRKPTHWFPIPKPPAVEGGE